MSEHSVLSLITAPVTEPITVGEAKAQARVDGTDDDVLITAQIAAARPWAEEFTNRAFVTQTWKWNLDRFPPNDAPIELPKAPLQSVTSVKYIDGDGIEQTWAATEYTVQAFSGPTAMPGRLWPKFGKTYPTPRDEPGAVRIEFIAGYGAASLVPEGIKAALKILVAELYERREEVVPGMVSGANRVPYNVEALLYPYRVF